YATGTALLVALPRHHFTGRRFDFVFLASEGLLVGWLAAAYFRGGAWVFYPMLLLTVLLATLARRLSWALIMAAAVAAGHAILVVGSGSFEWGVLLLQTALFLTTAGVVGYLAEELGREEVSAELVDNALEISTLLAGALDEKEVYDRACELLARLFRAGRVAIILIDRETGGAEVVAGMDRGERVQDLTIDIDRYPEIRTAIERRAPVVIGRADRDPDMAPVRGALPHRARRASLLVTPILQEGEPRGVVSVRLEGGGRLFTDHDIKLCRFMADAAGRALGRADEMAEVAEAARRDGLTGLYNVRVFHRRLADEVERTDRAGGRLSLVMVDLDHLKSVNDTYGHLAGDAVIRQTAMILAGHVRGIDTVARYGGEEFALLLPDTGAERAQVVAERLRARIERAEFGVIRQPLSVSIGIATYPDDATTPTDLLHKADDALYHSKNHGRNRVSAFARIDPGDLGIAAGSVPGLQILREKEDDMTSLLLEALGEASSDADRESDVVAGLTAALHERDPQSAEHLRTVATMAELFLANLALSGRERRSIHLACLLRDVGKLAIPEEILQKKGFLTREEYRQVREHHEIGARVLAPLPGLDAIVPSVRHHHERWDGKGYPDELRGEEIPYGARIVGLIDAFHAMIRRRPYADRSRGLRYASEEIRRNAGTQFDPDLAATFLFVVDTNRDILSTLVEEEPAPASDPSEGAA
ncbi:MAG TPA: diguanylate cyclase, partial [Gemmatimonadota bacterium]|nr:diguanylate cyclase [Gemmatimonadota bacterium]